MESILTGLITSIIGGADNVINSAFNGLIDMCFNSENYIASNFGSTVVDFSELKALILSLAISLIVLKFLKKGFDMYILWTDGDADTRALHSGGRESVSISRLFPSLKRDAISPLFALS